MNTLLRDLEQNIAKYRYTQPPTEIDGELYSVSYTCVYAESLIYQILMLGAYVEAGPLVDSPAYCHFCHKTRPCSMLTNTRSNFYNICTECCKICDSIIQHGDFYTVANDIPIYFINNKSLCRYTYVRQDPAIYPQMKALYDTEKRCQFCMHFWFASSTQPAYGCIDFIAPFKTAYLKQQYAKYMVFAAASPIRDVTLLIIRLLILVI